MKGSIPLTPIMNILLVVLIYLVFGAAVGIILAFLTESSEISFNSLSFFAIPLWPIYLLLFLAGFLFRFTRIVFIKIYDFKTIVDDVYLLLKIKRK